MIYLLDVNALRSDSSITSFTIAWFPGSTPKTRRPWQPASFSAGRCRSLEQVGIHHTTVASEFEMMKNMRAKINCEG
jgi:hypothetical protein